MAETTSRALALLNLLQTHRTWGGADLARRLAVTDRTLRRDIERLRELGYRIDATRGNAGGYRLAAGNRMPPLLLTDDETVTIAIGLRLAATQGIAGVEETTVGALAKLEQVLPPVLRERVNAVAAAVSPQSPRGGPVSPELLGQLALACRDHERIRFGYRAGDGTPSERRVEPAGLAAVQRSWFLVCFDLDRDDWRTFRVDRIDDLVVSTFRFTPRELPAISAAEYVRQSVAGLRRRVRAAVVLELPVAEARAHFGPWGRELEVIDERWTRWPFYAENYEQLLAALVWLPTGVAYRVEGPPEFVEFAARVGAGLISATA